MKKVIRLLVSVLAIVNIFVGTAFAGIPSPEIYTSVNQESKLCDKIFHIVREQQSLMTRRGDFLYQLMLL